MVLQTDVKIIQPQKQMNLIYLQENKVRYLEILWIELWKNEEGFRDYKKMYEVLDNENEESINIDESDKKILGIIKQENMGMRKVYK